MGQSWQTGRPLPIPLGSSVVFQQVDLRAAFCQPRPRLSLIEMLWGCIGKVATPLPKPLGSLCFLNETQKCKFFRCGSEVIRGFPSKIGFGTKTEPFWTSTRQRHPPNKKVFWWTPSFFHQHSTRQTHPANTLIYWLFAHLGEPGQGGWIFPPVYSFCNGKIILGL